MNFAGLAENLHLLEAPPGGAPAEKPPEKKYRLRTEGLLIIRERLSKDKKLSEKVHEKVLTLEKFFNNESKLLDAFAGSLQQAISRERSQKLQKTLVEYHNQVRERILDIGKAISQLRVTVASQLLNNGSEKELELAISDYDNIMKRNIKARNLREMDDIETHRVCKSLHEAWEKHLRRRGSSLEDYCLYLSNLFMFLHSKNISGCHHILDLLKDLDPKTEMLVVSTHAGSPQRQVGRPAHCLREPAAPRRAQQTTGPGSGLRRPAAARSDPDSSAAACRQELNSPDRGGSRRPRRAAISNCR